MIFTKRAKKIKKDGAIIKVVAIKIEAMVLIIQIVDKAKDIIKTNSRDLVILPLNTLFVKN